MAESEFESFVSKFKALSAAGIKANIKAETNNGNVKVCLTADIGKISCLFRHNVRYRSPAYTRRQERRRQRQLSTTSISQGQACGSPNFEDAVTAAVAPCENEVNHELNALSPELNSANITS